MKGALKTMTADGLFEKYPTLDSVMLYENPEKTVAIIIEVKLSEEHSVCGLYKCLQNSTKPWSSIEIFSPQKRDLVMNLQGIMTKWNYIIKDEIIDIDIKDFLKGVVSKIEEFVKENPKSERILDEFKSSLGKK
jgi:hypothetical protein